LVPLGAPLGLQQQIVILQTNFSKHFHSFPLLLGIICWHCRTKHLLQAQEEKKKVSSTNFNFETESWPLLKKIVHSFLSMICCFIVISAQLINT
jgi:hypothetical protein